MSDIPRVLVTGGSRGIGRVVAETLAASGVAVAVAARDAAVVAKTVAALRGEEHLALTLDVADEEAWEAALAQVDAWGPLSGLVHAAGVLGPIGKVGAVAPRDFAATIAINLHGTFLALHHVVPRLVERRGSAVTFSGGGGTGPLPRYDAYAASKAAVVRLTENVAEAVREDGVRVNCVAPGMVATRIHDATLAAGPDAVGEEYYERTRQALDEGAVPPQVAADLVAFLLSEQARPITGRLLSAQWDPWSDPNFQRRLVEDDALATLRRIDGMQVVTAEAGR